MPAHGIRRIEELMDGRGRRHEHRPLLGPSLRTFLFRERQTGMWAANSFKLFLSHTSAHREAAHALKDALIAEGISLFVAHDDIEATTDWQEQLQIALSTMDALAALLTSDFHASNWTDQEVGFALGAGRRLVPLKYDVVPYGFIRR